MIFGDIGPKASLLAVDFALMASSSQPKVFYGGHKVTVQIGSENADSGNLMSYCFLAFGFLN